MGNKLAGVSAQPLHHNEGPASLHACQRSDLRRGSTESLSTFVSLNSHADQCLLKERFSYSLDDSSLGRGGGSISETRLQSTDDTSTIITTLDDLNCDEYHSESVDDEAIREKLKIPEKLLQKLTTEDWNDLVHFICSSMEQSLQSNILKTVHELKDKNTQLLSSNDSSETKIIADNRQDEKAPLNCDIPPRRHKHRRKPRPLSMPLVSTSQLSDEKYMKKYDHGHHHRSHRRRTERIAPMPVGKEEELDNSHRSQSRLRASSNPHKVHFIDSRLTSKTLSGSSLDELEVNLKCKSLESRRGYLTLEQLKDLGLSLQQDSSTKSTCEQLSAFSMKCWHGDATGANKQQQQLTQLVSPKRRQKRRQRKRSMSRNKHELPQKQKPQFEQLCLLGPSTGPSPSPDPLLPSSSPLPDNNDNTEATKDDHDCVNVVTPTEPLSSSDDSSADVKVEHLHQHSHHHFHHFIHHSISQPTNLCGKNYSKPIHFIVSESQ